jgi:hypothetical protein
MVSYEVAQQMAGAERLPVSVQTLRHRLHAAGAPHSGGYSPPDSSSERTRSRELLNRLVQCPVVIVGFVGPQA